jgi:hypothetical protein
MEMTNRTRSLQPTPLAAESAPVRAMNWKHLVVALGIAALAVALCGCEPTAVVPSLAGDWDYKEVSRIRSPASSVEALLLTGDAGATTATRTYLYLVPSGSRLDAKKEAEQNLNRAVFVADHLKDLTVIRKNSRLVQIGYQEARIHHFENEWSHRDIRDYRYVVELRLAPSTNEFALPARDRNW